VIVKRLPEVRGMRIAVLSRYFVANGGGAERYAIAVVEQLAKGNEVHVFAQEISHSYPGVTYHILPMHLVRPRWINQLLFAYRTWLATRKGFDIVHSHENVWHGNVQAVHVLPTKYGLFRGRQGLDLWMKWLRVVTSPRLLTYLWLEHMRFAPRRRRRVVAASRALASAMLEVYPGAEQILEVITPGVEMPDLESGSEQNLRAEARKVLHLPLEGTCMLFVGNDFRKKGLPALIQALAQLDESSTGLFLAVAGNPAQRESMHALAAELGVADRVFFLGAVAQMDAAYRAADFLVHPTLQDSYAMVVLEAMAYGLPVIVSAAPYCGISDDLNHGVNALLIDDPRDFKQISGYLHTLITDPALRDALVANGIAFAAQHTWHAAGGAYKKLFAEVLA
jgi:glycosyltransferase involved in cell wall biosynthesis